MTGKQKKVIRDEERNGIQQSEGEGEWEVELITVHYMCVPVCQSEIHCAVELINIVNAIKIQINKFNKFAGYKISCISIH